MRASAVLILFVLCFVVSSSAQDLVPCPAPSARSVKARVAIATPVPAPVPGPRGPEGPTGPVGQIPQWYLWAILGSAGVSLLALGLAIGALAGHRNPGPVVVVNYPGAPQALNANTP